MPKVQALLRDYTGDFPDSSAHVHALKRLGENAPATVAEVPAPPSGVPGLTGLSELLTETPTRVALHALEGNPQAQAWA